MVFQKAIRVLKDSEVICGGILGPHLMQRKRLIE